MGDFAFPMMFQQPSSSGWTVQEGMSLRDYFAAKAMQGLLAGLYAGNNAGWTVEGNCKAAYEYADAMLAEREKTKV